MIAHETHSRTDVKKHPEVLVKLLMSFGILAVMVFRQPELLYQPRFFAEEGTSYFSFAFNNSLFETLITPQYGYYTLYNSIATAAATFFALENAPLVTTYLALGIQMLTAGMVIWGERPLFDTPWKRFVVALAIPLISYAEIWLNTIGMQYWFCIIAFLFLLEDPAAENGKIGPAKGALLFLCGMTGVVSCFMTPIFLLKAVTTKSRKYINYTIILAISSLLQISAFLRAFLAHDAALQSRMVHNNPVTLLTKTVIFQFAIPFSGRGIYELPSLGNMSESINQFIINTFSASPFPNGYLALPFMIGTTIILFFMYQTVGKFSQPDIRYIALAFIMVSTLSVLFSVNMSGGPRYTYAPSIMLVTMLVSLAGRPRRHIGTFLFAALLLVSSLVFNATEFRRTMSLSYNQDYPAWREEVRKWRIVGSAYPLQIWPPPWKMQLKKPAP